MMNYKMIIANLARKQNLIPPDKKKEMCDYIKNIPYLNNVSDYSMKIDKYNNDGNLIIDLDSLKVNDLKYIYENYFKPYIE